MSFETCIAAANCYIEHAIKRASIAAGPAGKPQLSPMVQYVEQCTCFGLHVKVSMSVITDILVS